MTLRELASRDGLNYRWLLWCDKTGRNPARPFGGCQSNAEYMAWIGKHSAEYQRARGIDRIMDQDDFTVWLENLGQMELAL